MVLVAIFLALAMEPGVDRLAHRGWRRGPATGLILGTVLVLGIGFLAAAGSVFVEQASDLVDEGPRYIRDIEEFLDDEFGISFDAEKVVREIENVPDETVASSAFDVTLTAFELLFQIFTVVVFAFYLAADGPRFRRSICARLPRRRQEIVLETWELAVDRTGAYLWSRTILATISAIATYVFLLALGIPNALALGVWVGVISQFIPTIGTYIALVLPVVVALQQAQPVDALWVLLFLVGYQQIENYVLMPRITKRTMEVHPALAIGTVFAGGLLLGGVGAVLALPATAVIQSLISAYTTEREVVESPLVEEPPDRPSRWAALRERLGRRRNRPDDSDVE
jgi:predicted PurR-regulated permease PerM